MYAPAPMPRFLIALVGLALWTATPSFGDGKDFANPAIDMAGYLRMARAAAEHRANRRVSEEQFVEMSRDPGTIVLDARSRDKYQELHLKGAVSLPFTDITVASLEQLIPDRATRILIYCNNNFRNAEGPFPSKLASASLNLSTYIALFTYGYRNVYELGPMLDPRDARLEFEPSLRPGAEAPRN